jgi:hypothetical protein
MTPEEMLAAITKIAIKERFRWATRLRDDAATISFVVGSLSGHLTFTGSAGWRNASQAGIFSPAFLSVR